MRQISFETWLFKEAMRFAKTDKRSIKVIANGSSRSREYLSYYFYYTDTFSSLKDEKVKEVVKRSFAIAHDKKLQEDFFKTLSLWQSVININEKKNMVMNIEIDNRKLNLVSKELNLRYSNVYRFFVKKDKSALKLIDAQNVVLLLTK